MATATVAADLHQPRFFRTAPIASHPPHPSSSSPSSRSFHCAPTLDSASMQKKKENKKDVFFAAFFFYTCCASFPTRPATKAGWIPVGPQTASKTQQHPTKNHKKNKPLKLGEHFNKTQEILEILSRDPLRYTAAMKKSVNPVELNV